MMVAAQLASASATRRVTVATAALIAALAADPARAMEFLVQPPVILAHGDIRNGDQYTFKKLLTGAAPGQIRIVDLDSHGGFVFAAGEIAHEIRDKGLLTLVDAGRSTCVSACTILFAGGTGRLYLNAGGVPDGATTKPVRGLGFHSGSSASSRDPNGYSGFGTGQVVDYYYAFGMAKAADLTTATPPNAVYMLSGPKALALGIATSLGAGERAAVGKKKR